MQFSSLLKFGLGYDPRPPNDTARERVDGMFQPKLPITDKKTKAIVPHCWWQHAYVHVWAFFLQILLFILHTCHLSSPEGCGMWQSHTPAGTWHLAESHILGSAFPGSPGSLPAEPLGYRSDTGSGPARLRSGLPFLSGHIPGSLSITEEERRISNDDFLKPKSFVISIILNSVLFFVFFFFNDRY